MFFYLRNLVLQIFDTLVYTYSFYFYPRPIKTNLTNFVVTWSDMRITTILWQSFILHVSFKWLSQNEFWILLQLLTYWIRHVWVIMSRFFPILFFIILDKCIPFEKVRTLYRYFWRIASKRLYKLQPFLCLCQ